MVRSKNYKLIISKDFNHYKFFDLVNDPYEFNNVAGEEKYKQEIARHKAFLAQTMTFDAISPVYVNEDEKTYSPEKKTNLIEREEVATYFKERIPYESGDC